MFIIKSTKFFYLWTKFFNARGWHLWSYLIHMFTVIKKNKYSFIQKLFYLKHHISLNSNIITFYLIFINKLNKFFYIQKSLRLNARHNLFITIIWKSKYFFLPISPLISINKKKNLLFANLNPLPYTNPIQYSRNNWKAIVGRDTRGNSTTHYLTSVQLSPEARIARTRKGEVKKSFHFQCNSCSPLPLLLSCSISISSSLNCEFGLRVAVFKVDFASRPSAMMERKGRSIKEKERVSLLLLQEIFAIGTLITG